MAVPLKAHASIVQMLLYHLRTESWKSSLMAQMFPLIHYYHSKTIGWLPTARDNGIYKRPRSETNVYKLCSPNLKELEFTFYGKL